MDRQLGPTDLDRQNLLTFFSFTSARTMLGLLSSGSAEADVSVVGT